MEDLHSLKLSPLVFRQILGLNINLEKGTIFGVNTSQDWLSRSTSMLDYKVFD